MRLGRRIALAVGLAGLAVVVWAAAPALSVNPYVPHVVEFQMRVPAVSAPRAVGSGARAAGGAVTTPVLRAAKRFDLFGLTWHGPVGGRVEVRARLASGRWTRWDVADHAVDVPDRSAPVRGTEPIWVGGADALQLRLPRSVHDVHAEFVNSTGTATAADRLRTRVLDAVHSAFIALAPGSADAGPTPVGGQPKIIPRSAWAGSQCRPRGAPSYGAVKLAFVHHTDNLNGYGPGQSAAIVLAICRFHRDTRGWGDIGYNFLVDRYGQIFEGRAGGIDRPVVGAQTKGFNLVSTGVANIGTFVSTSQTRAGMGALARRAGLEAHPARRAGDRPSASRHHRAGPQREAQGHRAAPQPDLRPSRRQLHRLPGQRAVRRAAEPAPSGERLGRTADQPRARRGAQPGPRRPARRPVRSPGPRRADARGRRPGWRSSFCAARRS